MERVELQRAGKWNMTSVGCSAMFALMTYLAMTGAHAEVSNVFYPKDLVEKARTNTAKYEWASEARDRIVASAEPWARMSDDELWGLMFGNTIKRSWMVWSDGHCPACNKGVPMYNWQIDALGQPWKVRCPHCKELFPKNDFLAFYRSGLDEHGVFDPERADRSLLFNTEHPDSDDPLHGFGVDDGVGYVDGDRCWRFVGAYLIYGQWKQAVLGGVRTLSDAYLVTGDHRYTHKAGILLDRIADLYPSFDFSKQGVMYDGRNITDGYVSTWHDACEETKLLSQAYDKVREGIRDDAALVTFLSAKSNEHKLDNAKSSFDDIRRNIEEGIFRDALTNRHKIHSNYPRMPIAVATMMMVLDWPENREEVYALLDEVLDKATAVDGVTGEKGLAGYSAFTISGLADFLALCDRLDPEFLPDMLRRHPQLRETYRFHVDTWCFRQYYPLIGDTGGFASKVNRYVGAAFTKDVRTEPSMFSFFRRLYELTGDPAYIQVLYHENGESVEGLPHDLFADDPHEFSRVVEEVIEREGAAPKVGSVNKQQWRLAILRSGDEENGRALWLDYDSGGGHGHMDGMNLGLFAKGLDLLPDFGYKPVQYGGWGSPKANWYGATASHNTVVVDGKNQNKADGRTTLWADGEVFRAIRASCPELIGGRQYERTAVMVDSSDRDSYVLDIFRVVGGKEHTKFVRSHFGSISTEGLTLEPTDDFAGLTEMRAFRIDPSPETGWSADWRIEDRYGYLPEGSEVHLRYIDLTADAEALTAESWVSLDMFHSNEEAWIPTLVVRRRSTGDALSSTFISIIEPYEGKSAIARIRRLGMETRDGAAFPEANVAIEIVLSDGRRDLLVAADVENPLGLTPSKAGRGVLVQPDWGVRTDAELCLVRLTPSGEVEHIALAKGKFAAMGDTMLSLEETTDFAESHFGDR